MFMMDKDRSPKDAPRICRTKAQINEDLKRRGMMNDYFLRVFVKERLLMEEAKANQLSIAREEFKTDVFRTFIQKLKTAVAGLPGQRWGKPDFRLTSHMENQSKSIR